MIPEELIINGDLYAYYEIEGDHIYLKMLIEVYPEDSKKSEDWLIMVIQGIAQTKFTQASYLNV